MYITDTCFPSTCLFLLSTSCFWRNTDKETVHACGQVEGPEPEMILSEYKRGFFSVPYTYLSPFSVLHRQLSDPWVHRVSCHLMCGISGDTVHTLHALPSGFLGFRLSLGRLLNSPSGINNDSIMQI